MLQNFFSYVNKGGLDWAFWVFIFILLAMEIHGWIRKRMSCPVCGCRVVISRINEELQYDVWACPECNWSAVQEFN